MPVLLWIALAGALGAVSRHGVALAAERAAGAGFPWGTLIVNAIGSILLGFLLESVVRAGWSNEVKLALGTGFLGAFTTFSTFSVETVRLIEAGRYAAAGGNAVGNVALGLGGAMLGIWLALRVHG